MEDDCMKNDDMNPLERMQAIADGRPFDRIPFVPLLGDTAAHIIDTTVSEYHHSAKLMAEVEIAVYHRFGQDGVGVGPGYSGLAEALGTQLNFPENDIPFVKAPALKEWRELDGLEPANPKASGRLPLFLEALQILKDKLGRAVPVGSCIGGPLTAAAFIRGTDQLLRDFIKNPAKVHTLMQLVTDSALLYIDAVLDLDCNISIADPVASGTLISAKKFCEFVKPYLTQYAHRVQAKTGAGPMLHICGNTMRIWRDMAETGAATLSLDNVVDLAKAKELVGNMVCLMGNVDPINIIAKGSKEEIYAAVENCFIQAGDNPKGFILSSGCQIPIGTPLKNIQHFADAARIHGRRPFEPTDLKQDK